KKVPAAGVFTSRRPHMSRPEGRWPAFAEGLLLEEVAEPATRVVGMHRTAGCVALDGDHDREQRTVVAGALVANALGDVLRAFETARWIKVRALAAGVQLRLALRATRKRIGGDRQGGATLGASRRRAALEDAEGARGSGALTTVLASSRRAAPVALLTIFAVAHDLSFPEGGGTSCTSSRSRSSRDRCGRSSRLSACAAPALVSVRAKAPSTRTASSHPNA